MLIKEKIKNLLKRNQTIINIYRRFRYIDETQIFFFIKNYKNIEKLKLLLKVKPYTMVTYPRLSNTYELSELVEKKKKKGCFVECAQWNISLLTSRKGFLQ